MRHRLGAHDAEALPAGWDRHDGRPAVLAIELGGRKEPERVGNAVAKRPVADDHARQARVAATKSSTPFSGESRPA